MCNFVKLLSFITSFQNSNKKFLLVSLPSFNYISVCWWWGGGIIFTYCFYCLSFIIIYSVMRIRVTLMRQGVIHVQIIFDNNKRMYMYNTDKLYFCTCTSLKMSLKQYVVLLITYSYVNVNHSGPAEGPNGYGLNEFESTPNMYICRSYCNKNKPPLLRVLPDFCLIVLVIFRSRKKWKINYQQATDFDQQARLSFQLRRAKK